MRNAFPNGDSANPRRGAASKYDGHIGHYVEFLRRQGRELGFEVRTDRQAPGPVYSIEERDREQKKQAREWLNGLPDLWEWLT